MGDVRLVDLEVFKRYSLAIRQESAPVEEVLAVLEATRRQVEAGAAPPLAPPTAADAPSGRSVRRRSRRPPDGTDGNAGAAVPSGR